jgi:hypothetical protein
MGNDAPFLGLCVHLKSKGNYKNRNAFPVAKEFLMHNGRALGITGELHQGRDTYINL